MIRGATRRDFGNLIDLAIEEEVAFVLIAGDLHDGDYQKLFFPVTFRVSPNDFGVFLFLGVPIKTISDGKGQFDYPARGERLPAG